MKLYKAGLLLIACALFAFVMSTAITFIKYEKDRRILSEAFHLIKEAKNEEGEKKGERYNQALNLLLEASSTSAEINAARGLLLAEFQELPLALYFMRQALILDPDQVDYQKGLKQITALGNIPPPPSLPSSFRLGGWGLVSFVVSFICLTLWLFLRRQWIVVALVASFLPLMIEQAYSFRDHYLSPIEGIAVRPLKLYPKTDQKHETRFLDRGEIVEVVGVESKNSLFKIKTTHHEIGYVDSSLIRIFLLP